MKCSLIGIRPIGNATFWNEEYINKIYLEIFEASNNFYIQCISETQNQIIDNFSISTYNCILINHTANGENVNLNKLIFDNVYAELNPGTSEYILNATAFSISSISESSSSEYENCVDDMNSIKSSNDVPASHDMDDFDNWDCNFTNEELNELKTDLPELQHVIFFIFFKYYIFN